MAIKIRLSRGGSKKRPFYRVVAADSRMPRDGRFIEKLGTYNPLLPKEDPNRVNLNIDKINDWLKKGAQVSDRISRMLENLSVLDPKKRNNPNKGKKHKATLEREASKSEKEQKTKDENSDISEENNEKNSQEIPEDSVNNDNDNSKTEKGNSPASEKEPEPSENKIDIAETATDKTKPTDQNEVEEKTEVTKEETVDTSSDVEPKEKK